ncbi:MAG TPA: alanine--tRNA ligase, partial [Candidatus Binataceae bacterium]|nr:alanine--tRNA ligase [Candidatus Binataceae bacterium]
MPSAPLIPKGDPTLLFTNAGMVPFKDYFLGLRTPATRRVADCQKCLRISGKHNDLEAVGRDSYHHTFFEMLGNWSFGDYYKAEAIPWHWELVTKVWEIPAEKLWATVYKDDDEAFAVWEKVPDLPAGRILRFGEKDNFWEMGETGPCGPCSEIHIDRGDEAAQFCEHPRQACGVNVDGCARFIELGNLVFIQYNRDGGGKLTPLPMRHVDTGTGLERVASVMQSLETARLLGNYDIDVFQTIIATIQQFIIGDDKKYGKHEESDISYRAIADHSRAISFLIADGVLPGNTDREYVLRRLIRRSARHGRQLGIEQPFLAEIANAAAEAMGRAYPELVSNAARIRKAITEEETRFGETLDRGLELIDVEIERLQGAGQSVLPGEVAFKLYDTYGFPLDLTSDVLRNRGFTVDANGFDLLMEEQRERGRAARMTINESLRISEGPMTLQLGSTPMQEASSKFIGNHLYQGESEIVAANTFQQQPESELVIRIAAAETPFYPEGGGQVGDRGVIETESGALAEIIDTRKQNGAIVHVGRILRGPIGDFHPGKRIKLQIDRERRDAAMLNHSATHILHYALREILGNEVHQAGSMVSPERLRFD